MGFPNEIAQQSLFNSVKKRFPAASKDSIESLIELAKIRDLNPLDTQLQMIMRKEVKKIGGKDSWIEKWIPMIGIDGFRSIAARTGRYGGGTAPEWAFSDGNKINWHTACDPDWGAPLAARVGVYIIGCDVPTYNTVHMNEYASYKKDKNSGIQLLSGAWATKPNLMLGKCAEAGALRRGFPDVLSGIYTPDEFSGINGTDFVDASGNMIVDVQSQAQSKSEYEPEPIQVSEKFIKAKKIVGQWIRDNFVFINHFDTVLARGIKDNWKTLNGNQVLILIDRIDNLILDSGVIGNERQFERQEVQVFDMWLFNNNYSPDFRVELNSMLKSTKS